MKSTNETSLGTVKKWSLKIVGLNILMTRPTYIDIVCIGMARPTYIDIVCIGMARPTYIDIVCIGMARPTYIDIVCIGMARPTYIDIVCIGIKKGGLISKMNSKSSDLHREFVLT